MMLSIVIPVFNEEANLETLYKRLHEAAQKLNMDYEFIFVDDGSTDTSYDRIATLHRTDPRVKMLSFSRNFGHQTALTAGMDAANGDAVILMDADLQHPPEIVKTLVHQWRQGYEIVHTLRQTEGHSFGLKTLTSFIFYRLFRCLTRIDLMQNAADFRLLDRKAVEALRTLRERTRFLRGITVWIGFRSIAIPYQPEARYAGKTKYSWSRMINLALNGLVSFSVAPLYVAIFIGFALSGLGLIETLYALYIRLMTHHAFPGWASLIIWVSLVGGIQLMLMGVSGIYIAKIYEEVKQRPLYVVRERLGFQKDFHQPDQK